jgi:hypothetical protein
LIRFEIPLREPHLPHGRPAQVAYGEKKREGKLVTHLAEKRIVEAIRDMKNQGLSLRQISGFLTKMKVPTKRRGKSWHPEMVKRILVRESADAKEADAKGAIASLATSKAFVP